MSRSYKKHAIHKDTDKSYKRMSSKRIRQWMKLEDRGFKSSRQFKHQVNHCDICDWRYVPETEYWKIKFKRK